MDVYAKPRCQSDDACTVKHSYCWVSHKHKYIYFETPKCGSTTIKLIMPDKKMVRELEDSVADKYFKFSFVRNPWDRMVSNYYSFFVEEKVPVLERNRSALLRDLFGTNQMNFREFIEAFPYSSNHHWEQCHVFFEGFELDFVGRFEDYTNDLRKVYGKLGLSQRSIPQINKTDHKRYMEYYEPDLVEIVVKEFAGDIERFDYAFDIT